MSHVVGHASRGDRPSTPTYFAEQKDFGFFLTQLAQPLPVALPLAFRRHEPSSAHGVGDRVNVGATVGRRDNVGPGTGAGVGHEPQATGHAWIEVTLALLAFDDLQNFEGFVATQSHVRVE